MEKIYVCYRRDEDGRVVCDVRDMEHRFEYPLEHIGLHSPDGFEMGYGGSGPAELALMILCDHLRIDKPTKRMFMGMALSELPRKAWCLHQGFKSKFIAPYDDIVEITTQEIDEWIAAQGETKGDAA